MKKKALSLFLTLALLFSVSPPLAWAEEATDAPAEAGNVLSDAAETSSLATTDPDASAPDETVAHENPPIASLKDPNDLCGDTVTWTLSGDTLTISGKGAMYSYPSGETPWNGQQFSTVRVNSGVTVIGKSAFEFNGVKTVYVPLSVEKVEDAAFYGDPVEHIYYEGSDSQWRGVTKSTNGNYYFNQAEVHYYYGQQDSDDPFQNADSLFAFEVHSGGFQDEIYKTVYTESSIQNHHYYTIYAALGNWCFGSANLGVRFADEAMNNRYAVTVYKGFYASEEAAVQANAEDITAQIWNPDWTASTGYSDTFYMELIRDIPIFTLVSKKDGVTADTRSIGVQMDLPLVSVFAPTNLYQDSGAGRVAAAALKNKKTDETPKVYQYVPETQTENSRYYISVMPGVAMGTASSDKSFSYVSFIYKAMPGYITDQAAIPGADDITSQLFSSALSGGYLADFSGGAVDVTILDITGSFHYLRFELSDGSVTPEPEPEPTGFFYNLFNKKVAVPAFDADGNYAIPLGNNPFFPYQLQITDDTGKSAAYYFMNENDAVTVGGHKFSVTFSGTARRIGLRVNGAYFPAYPENKEFNENGQNHYEHSLFPVIDLSEQTALFTSGAMRQALIDAKLSENGEISWQGNFHGDFLSADTPIDLERLGEYGPLQFTVIDSTLLTWEDEYTVTVRIPKVDNLLEFEVYTDSERATIYYNDFLSAAKYSDLGVLWDTYSLCAKYGLWLKQTSRLSMRFANDTPEGMTVKVYEGYYKSEQEAQTAGARDITAQVWNQPDMAASGGYSGNYAASLDSAPRFTLITYLDGAVSGCQPFVVKMVRDTVSVSPPLFLYDGENRDYAAGFYRADTDIENSAKAKRTDGQSYEYVMYQADKKATGKYYISLEAYISSEAGPRTVNAGANAIQKAVEGWISSTEAFESAVDIKEQLFSDASLTDGGYLADFSNYGVLYFTILDGANDVQYVCISILSEDMGEPLTTDPDALFNVRYALDNTKRTPQKSLSMSTIDSYDNNGYQTILQVNEPSLEPESVIYPVFTAPEQFTVYASQTGVSPDAQISGKTPQRLSAAPTRYTVALKRNGSGDSLVPTENFIPTKNYWVTFIQPQTGGSQLFVNAASNAEDLHKEGGYPRRDVFFDAKRGFYHDVAIANIGDQPLRDITVKLAANPDGTGEAVNVQLDPTHAVRTEMAAFTSGADTGSYTQSIRLIPKFDEKGDYLLGTVSGYLIIKTDGGDMTVKLSGTTSEPKFATQQMTDGVKYVHYSTIIQTSSMYDDDNVTFTLKAGQLPNGLALLENGEVYGVPQKEGVFEFTVRVTYGNNLYMEQPYKIEILDNSDAHVWAINDYKDNLTVNDTTVVGTAVEYNPDNGDLKIRTEAEFAQFVKKLALDGQTLAIDTDYTAIPGSTIVTVRSQTLRNAPDGSKHTISLENRAGGLANQKTTLTRTSINVTVKKSSGGSGSSSGGGSGGGGGSSSGGGSGGGGGSSSGGGSSGGGGSSSGGGSSRTKVTTYSISVKSSSYGSLSVNRKSAASGATVTVTAHPKDGYALDNVTVTDSKGNAIPVSGDGETRTFTMPARRVTVSATFSRFYRVSAMKLDFGWLEVKPEGSVPPNTKITLIAHPENGYRAESLRAYMGDTLISVTDNGNGTATFTMPSGDVEASATFTPIPPLEKFPDIKPTDWFYNDAAWALERGIMNGVTEVMWSPQDYISTATVVVTLARLQMGDQTKDILKEFESDIYAENRSWLPDIGEWYYLEARWAAASEILTENVFTGREPLSRAGFAILLRNYLRYRGIQTEVPTPYEFSDSAFIKAHGVQLGEDLNGAFQLLREAGIFQGDKTNAMLPSNLSTRAHMAALLHRLSDYVIKVETAEG